MSNYVWPWPGLAPEEWVPFIEQEKENIRNANFDEVFYDYEYKYPNKVTAVLLSFFLYCGISALVIVDNLSLIPKHFFRFIVLDEKLIFSNNIRRAAARCLLELVNLDIVIDTDVEIPEDSIGISGGSIVFGELCCLQNSFSWLENVLVLCYRKHLNLDEKLRKYYELLPENVIILD